MSIGTVALTRDSPDDFGNEYIPYSIICVDDFGNLRVRWHFDQMSFLSRLYFIEGF